MTAAKNISQLLLLSCLLFFPSVFALPKPYQSKIIKAINRKGPYFGIIASSAVEKEFFATKEFQPDSENPYVDLSGRRFQVGEVYEERVIYVSSGVGLVNAAAVTQLILDLFYVRGIVHIGTAVSVNSSLNIGDVIIPKEFVNTGLWDWLNPGATIPSNDFAKLDIKDFNVPKEGSNSLGHIGYSPEEVYFDKGIAEPIVWFNVDTEWLQVASKLEKLELAQCVNASLCLKNKPKVVLGLKGSTSNIYVDNAAYKEFLYKTFGVASTDMESTAIMMTAISNGYPAISAIALRDIVSSDDPQQFKSFWPIVSTNIAEFLLGFIGFAHILEVPKSSITMYE